MSAVDGLSTLMVEKAAAWASRAWLRFCSTEYSCMKPLTSAGLRMDRKRSNEANEDFQGMSERARTTCVRWLCSTALPRTVPPVKSCKSEHAQLETGGGLFSAGEAYLSAAPGAMPTRTAHFSRGSTR